MLVKNAKAMPHTVQRADIQERRLALLSKIKLWRETQRVYMPQASIFLSTYESNQPFGDSGDGIRTDVPPLCLPSNLPPLLRVALPPEYGLVEKELRLRVAQCDDALSELRKLLRIRSLAVMQKKKSARGQKESTRARSVLGQLSSRIQLAADRYREAFEALQIIDLDTNASWRTRLQVLKIEDVRSMDEVEDDDDAGDLGDNADSQRKASRKQKRKGKGNGYRASSWIWMAVKPDANDSSDEGLNTGEFIYSYINIYL